MPDQRRSFRYALLVAIVAAMLFPTQVSAARADTATGTHKLRAAETRVLRKVNRIRVRNGRRPLHLDKATSHVARARSADMAAKHYFAHVEPDGDDARRILRRRDIPAASVMENIGHTYGLSLKAGSKRMAKWWYRSAPHRRQMLARVNNYIGIGIARHGSRFTYTAIFTRSRDKTEPHVVIDEATLSDDGTRVALDWHAVDPRLANGTAGIEGYDLERFSAVGDWRSVDVDVHGSERAFWTPGIDDLHVRIRAVDKAGNVGPWAYTHVETTAYRSLRTWPSEHVVAGAPPLVSRVGSADWMSRTIDALTRQIPVASHSAPM